jgi:hypothetical protein
MSEIVANPNANTVFKIPVEWTVCDFVEVRANSLEEGIDYVNKNRNNIPLGTNPEYVDGSYQVTPHNSNDEIAAYQQTGDKDIVCVEFNCEEELSQFTDSMLFDSEDTSIAAARFVNKNGKAVTVDLCVRGEVAVDYKGETYHRPSEFPDELIERIKNQPNDWDVYAPSGEGNDEEEGDIYVGLNNWFEYIWNYDNGASDGIVCEQDISKMTVQDVLRELKEIAEWVFNGDEE